MRVLKKKILNIILIISWLYWLRRVVYSKEIYLLLQSQVDKQIKTNSVFIIA